MIRREGFLTRLSISLAIAGYLILALHFGGMIARNEDAPIFGAIVGGALITVVLAVALFVFACILYLVIGFLKWLFTGEWPV